MTEGVMQRERNGHLELARLQERLEVRSSGPDDWTL